jgi:ATP-dependent helicase Lhr and Lhr-like helicase
MAIRVTGARDVEILGPSEESGWFPLKSSISISTLYERFEVIPSANLGESAERRLWQALSCADLERTRKVLVFVPTRNLCDKLSAHLSATLQRRRDIRVLAHHGSLDRSRREYAEQTFASARDAVLVATTTLEVGVDIGDVDLVTLVGAPPGTRSLLQRIGRAGRRIGRTRVLALPRSALERAALASMLVSARDGTLEPESYARRWSVFVQQAGSFVAQARFRGRRLGDLLELADDVWPETPSRTAQEVLQELLDSDYLGERMGRLTLGEPWADAFDRGLGGMHANLESSATGIPVVDSGTGEVIAHVAGRPTVDTGLALGGQVWDVRYVDGEVLLSPRISNQVRDGFRYATRSAPTGLEYAVHVRRGLGFVDADAPIVPFGEDRIWLHFGGSAYQADLVSLIPSLRPVSGLAGLAVVGEPSKEQLDKLASQKGLLLETIESLVDSIESTLAPGPYHRYLPEACRKRVTVDLFNLPQFRSWLGSRDVWTIRPDDQRLLALRAALSRAAEA